mmetsp:Transcript_5909/g.9615  ORF Transcript_5909/g.9615 Transcript_5909/m.9615 type:complete len:125 (+) Transcript_5909:2530-2904(+)
MILKSEGVRIKDCTAPSCDRKYVLMAFTQLVTQHPTAFLENSIQVVISSLIDLAFRPVGTNAATSQHADDMLEDGVIDQTFSFTRLKHVQLQSAKVEMSDKLAQTVPDAEAQLLQMLNEFVKSQ